ncbi:MAG: phosphoribosyltransferase [Lachnospiraceae bacterium]|nr:phosphoribosyltransferase [Lachnospiraceae bacterium]
MDESRIIKYYSPKDPRIAIKVINGHFATPNSHINSYLDMTTMKTRANEAERIAVAMTTYYNLLDKPIDTIVSMDGTGVIGAYLARELTAAGVLSTNAHKTIYVVTPEFGPEGMMIFRDNLKPEITNKNVLLLVASTSTGKTINAALNCITYYGGIIQGISAIFSNTDSIQGYHIDALFHEEDIPNYQAYQTHECPFCKEGTPIEAIVNGHGYSLL